MLGLRPAGELTVVIRDADTGEFVRVPETPGRLLAVSPSGDELLYLDDHDGGLCVDELSTGRRRSLAVAVDGPAAMSPDGGWVATIGTDGIDLIDLAGGGRRRLATVSGSATESAICWSPHGRFLAATYLTGDDEFATRVTDRCGTVVAEYDRTAILCGGNGSWAGDDELVCTGETGLHAVDVRGGGRRPLHHGHLVLAVLGGRLVERLPWENDHPTRLVTASCDGTDVRPLVTIHPGTQVELFGCGT